MGQNDETIRSAAHPILHIPPEDIGYGVAYLDGLYGTYPVAIGKDWIRSVFSRILNCAEFRGWGPFVTVTERVERVHDVLVETDNRTTGIRFTVVNGAIISELGLNSLAMSKTPVPRAVLKEIEAAIVACEWLVEERLLPTEFKLWLGSYRTNDYSVTAAPPPYDPHFPAPTVVVSEQMTPIYAYASYSPY